MIYEYKCFQCKKLFDVAKPVSRYLDEEICVSCGAVADRVPFPRKTHLSGTAVQDKKFNHALGRVCTDREAKQIAKEQGMIEVGNEDVSKHADTVRSDLDKAADKAYDDIWKGV